MTAMTDTAPRSLAIRDARVATFDAQRRDLPRADIVVEDGRIAAIGPNAAREWPRPVATTIEAAGMLAMPGLINAHFHSPGNLMKGLLDGLPLEIFMLYEVPPVAEDGDSERMAELRTMIGALEMLERGITTVHDDAYHVPHVTTGGIDAIMRGYRDTGMRAAVSIDQPNIVEYDKYPFLRDLLPEAERRAMENAPRQSGSELCALYDHLLSRWHGAQDGRLTAALSISAPQRVTHDYFAALSALSRERKLPFNVHVLESKLQRVLGEEKFGKSLVRHVEDLGFLDENMLVIHAIWIDDADIRLLAEAGCTVAHNPVCNLRLGSGIAPFRALRDAGIPVAIGTDEMCTDDTTNLWFVMKTAAMLHTLTERDYTRWPRAGEILDCVLRGGARAIRAEGRLGLLAPGAAADIALLDLNTAAFTPFNDLERQLVHCEDGSSVRHVIVDGRVVIRDRRHQLVDVESIRTEARRVVEAGAERFARLRKDAARLEPYYRAMYERAHARDVGMRRRLEP